MKYQLVMPSWISDSIWRFPKVVVTWYQVVLTLLSKTVGLSCGVHVVEEVAKLLLVMKMKMTGKRGLRHINSGITTMTMNLANSCVVQMKSISEVQHAKGVEVANCVKAPVA